MEDFAQSLVGTDCHMAGCKTTEVERWKISEGSYSRGILTYIRGLVHVDPSAIDINARFWIVKLQEFMIPISGILTVEKVRLYNAYLTVLELNQS